MIARTIAGRDQRPRRKLGIAYTSWEDEDFGQKIRRQSLQVPPPSQKPRKVSTTSVHSIASDGNERYGNEAVKAKYATTRGLQRQPTCSRKVSQMHQKVLGSVEEDEVPGDGSVVSPPSPSNVKKRVNLRVCGQLFQTQETTLNFFPTTLLGCKSERAKYYVKECDEFVFDRCIFAFDAILFYYQSRGILAKPAYVQRDKFLQELEFFQIDDIFDERQRKELELLRNKQNKQQGPDPKCKKCIWKTMLFHKSRMVSKLFYLLYVSNLVLSVLVVCVEPSITSKWWFYLELVLCCVFIIELCIHLIITTDRYIYITSPFGLMDIFSTLSSVCSLFSYLTHAPGHLVTFSKVFRLMRLFKFTRVSRGLQQFVYVLYASRENLSSFLTILIISCLACAIFVQNSEDLEVEVGFLNWIWFAFITASGVGYGDYYPKSLPGKICGVALSIVGVWIFCLPASLLVGKFVQLYYLPEIAEIQSAAGNERIGEGQVKSKKHESERKQLMNYTRDVYFAEVMD